MYRFSIGLIFLILFRDKSKISNCVKWYNAEISLILFLLKFNSVNCFNSNKYDKSLILLPNSVNFFKLTKFDKNDKHEILEEYIFNIFKLVKLTNVDLILKFSIFNFVKFVIFVIISFKQNFLYFEFKFKSVIFVDFVKKAKFKYCFSGALIIIFNFCKLYKLYKDVFGALGHW